MNQFHKCGRENCEICKSYKDFAEPTDTTAYFHGCKKKNPILWELLYLCIVITAVFFLTLFLCGFAQCDEVSSPETSSYQIKCELNSNTVYSSFAVCSGTAISPHFYVSCGHLLDDINASNVKASVLIGKQWFPIKLVKYTNWKSNGDIDLSLWLLADDTFPSYVAPGISDSKLGTDLEFVGFGTKNIKHKEQIKLSENRQAFKNWAAELLTTFPGEFGDSGGGIFHNGNLIAVRKAKIHDTNFAANCTNAQLINFLYPDRLEKQIKTQCYQYQGRQYCVPAPTIIIQKPQRNLQIGPVQNVFPQQPKSIPLQPVKPQIKQPIPEKIIQVPKKEESDLCKPYKDEIVKLENEIERLKKAPTADKDTYVKKIQELEWQLVAAKRFWVYFTLENDENCIDTDVESARIREKGLNIVTVVLKRQDVAVNSVPRLFLMPQRQTVYGKTDVLKYLQSIN